MIVKKALRFAQAIGLMALLALAGCPSSTLPQTGATTPVASGPAPVRLGLHGQPSTTVVTLDPSSLSSLQTTAAVATSAMSTALEASHVIANRSGTHLSTTVQIAAEAPTATLFVVLIQGVTSLPSNGAYGGGASLFRVLRVDHVTGTTDTVTFDDTPNGVAFTTGLVAAISSTEFTFTVGGNYGVFSSNYL